MVGTIKITDGPPQWGVMEMAFQGKSMTFELERPLPGSDVSAAWVALKAFAPESHHEIGGRLVEQGVIPTKPGLKESCLIMGPGCPPRTGYFTVVTYIAYCWQCRQGLLTYVSQGNGQKIKLREFDFPLIDLWEKKLLGNMD